MGIEERLLDMKEQIEQAKNKKAQAQGRLEEIATRLKTTFKVGSVEAAEKRLAEMAKQIDQLTATIEEKMSALEEQYEW